MFHPWIIFLLALFGTLIEASRCNITSTHQHQHRLFILSDIANEPDDAQSLVRLLVYSNEFHIKGLVATTSFWQNDTTRPDQMHNIVDAYAQVLPNLKKHAAGYPNASHLHSLIKSGSTRYGQAGVGEAQDSDGSNLLIQAVDASDKPLWVLAWGGANTLAQALWYVQNTRTTRETDNFVSKLRAYAISDQDNSGPWIRRTWPALFYIASVHHFNRYAHAAWGGISGDKYYHFPSAADEDVISAAWLKENIQIGPLGAKYPDADFIVEGDTPSLLYMIPNGLSDPQQPEWGSWGGRYGPVAWGEGHFADSIDTILDGERTIMSSQGTIWRWRRAFQNDFKARMQWTIQSEYKNANHAPLAVVNGDSTRDVLEYVVQADQEVILDASTSCDPDGDGVSFKWWQYLEPSSNLNSPRRDVPVLELGETNSTRLVVRMPSADVLGRSGRGVDPAADKHLHVILEVSDGELVAYRRVILTTKGFA
ncbi:hypothetical protein ASPWEDRAFT_126352 [Aspergillus wentii DTO 134E9]|uniref:Cellulose-binding protein n=1 Tax=Aspergillus wentii DTO 134E9 TaxID=1073089 RepID=A0A1L9RT00_ASPWE|nr:uncharacterized protein ASPWEDRAFT_126352 [Aspergillus wentii DTO 134E9]KAI9933723.1 hypothetical protein MW887_004794 [Aspergillus wentii]OJJ38062.1 hypothetical protein ASPWEDRAFT_126352 [Aspergillus wentii DTO 134E9]